MMHQALKRMRFLLNAREKIAGISFTDTAIYGALRTNEQSIAPAVVITHPLPKNVIVDGVVLDHEALAHELESALRAFHTPVSFINLSLPSALIFSTILHLPRSNNSSSNYDKAIQLLLDVELPWKRAAAYTDYKLSEGTHELRVSVFSILRATADPYILAAGQAGVEILALEFDAMSVERLMAPRENNALVITATETHVNICIAQNNTVRFVFSIPIEKVPDVAVLQREITRIHNYFTTETAETAESDMKGIMLNDTSKAFLLGHEDNVVVYPAAGAALRNPVPAINLREISLLPLRPDELYNLYRIASGLQLLRQATIATCIILLGAHLLLIQVLSTVAKQSIERATNAPHLYSNIEELDDESTALNQALAISDTIRTRMQRYASTFDLIDHIATDGVKINAITTGGVGAPITISGIAATRNQYNFFRTSIATADRLDVLSFPLGNLDISTDIPFSLTVKMKTAL